MVSQSLNNVTEIEAFSFNLNLGVVRSVNKYLNHRLITNRSSENTKNLLAHRNKHSNLKYHLFLFLVKEIKVFATSTFHLSNLMVKSFPMSNLIVLTEFLV